MKSEMIRSLFVAAALVASLTSALAGNAEKKSGCAAAAADAKCKALKGIVHLRDNDVRFARKSGVVFVDPTAGPTDPLAVKAGLIKPDLILITHPHGDHFQPAVLKEYLAANPQLILAGPAEVVKLAADNGIAGMRTVAPNQVYTLAGFDVGTVPAYFSNPNYQHPRANGWVGYVLTLNGVRYYVTGDTEAIPDMATTKADVIFPLLSGCGGNTEDALKMAAISGAKFVVPVHTSGQVETIKKYLAQLPEGVASAYYLDATPASAL